MVDDVPTPSPLERFGQNLLVLLQPKVSTQSLIVFTRQISSLLRSGIALADALALVAGLTEEAALRTALADATRRVQGGRRFATSLRRHPRIFPETYVAMVEAGEEAGRLDEILERLAQGLEKLEKIRTQVRGAATGPAAIAVVTLVVLLALTIFVVPIFEALFREANVPLPALTQAIVGLSNGVRSPWLPIPLLLAWMLFSVSRQTIRSSPALRYGFDALILQLPVIGGFIAKSTTASMLRVLVTLLDSGISITDALTITSRTVGNRVIRQSLVQARAQVAGGGRLSSAFEQAPYLPRLFVRLLIVGEQSGDLLTMLSRAATIFEEELEVAVKVVSRLLEPLFTVTISLVVGTVLVGLYLPLFNLGKVFMRMKGIG